MRRRSISAAASVLIFLTAALGCTITQTANPVPHIPNAPMEMCVVERPDVNKEFLPAYEAALQRKGFTVRVLPAGSDVLECPLTSTYIGKWSWDFVPYMAYAQIVVYRNGVRVGDALYESPTAGWSLTTKIYKPTEEKVGTMVDQLFPSKQ